MAEESSHRKQVRLVWTGLEDERVTWANQILVQHHASEFVITFGQMTTPPLLGSDEEKAELLESIEAVPIIAVARIGMSAQRMTEFVRVMQENLRNYEANKGLLAEEETDGPD